MSTAASWTDPSTGPVGSRFVEPVRDLRALLAFRASGLGPKGRLRLMIGLGLVLGLTLSAAVVPAYVVEANGRAGVGKLVAILPSVYLGFLVLAVISAAASGGGRELVPRDQAVAFPVSSTTDHLGSLLLAPLNVAWLLQAWTMLGMTSYTSGHVRLWATELPVIAYIVLATALGQVIAWTLEWLRRGPHGRLVSRSIMAGLGGTAAAIVITHQVGPVLDNSPTVHVYIAALSASTLDLHRYVLPTVLTAVLAAAAVLLGAVPAGWASRRAPREEHRLETGLFRARSNPSSDLWAMVRIDRGGVWRSVPLRRGLLVLAAMPGLIAFAGHLEWNRLTILPGLVASGAALLFGVNGWCLDGRGGLWRQSLPVEPGLAFLSRVWVLAEVLVGTALLTLVLGAVRAGRPTPQELVALGCAVVVVVGQVVSASMRWSVARPFSVDMRSARATPAPPVVMVGYSTRLALTTTFVGLVFAALSELRGVDITLLLALLLVLISTLRTVRTARRWRDPETRARVVVTVAG